ncbi:MAG: hypothetical protein ACRD1J_08750 [Terriglobia bacterium]
MATFIYMGGPKAHVTLRMTVPYRFSINCYTIEATVYHYRCTAAHHGAQLKNTRERINHTGQQLTKTQVLNLFRSETTAVNKLRHEDIHVHKYGNTAVLTGVPSRN